MTIENQTTGDLVKLDMLTPALQRQNYLPIMNWFLQLNE